MDGVTRHCVEMKRNVMAISTGTSVITSTSSLSIYGKLYGKLHAFKGFFNLIYLDTLIAIAIPEIHVRITDYIAGPGCHVILTPPSQTTQGISKHYYLDIHFTYL